MSQAILDTARCIWCGHPFERTDPKINLCPVCLKTRAEV